MKWSERDTEEGKLLPHWATGLVGDGNMFTPGALWCTKDGRKFGNAFIIKSFHMEAFAMGSDAGLYEMYTDAGSSIKLTKSEIRRYFYEPKYIADVEKVKRRREVLMAVNKGHDINEVFKDPHIKSSMDQLMKVFDRDWHNKNG